MPKINNNISLWAASHRILILAQFGAKPSPLSLLPQVIHYQHFSNSFKIQLVYVDAILFSRSRFTDKMSSFAFSLQFSSSLLPDLRDNTVF